MPEYLKAAQAAEYLGISRTTFWRLRRDYPLKAYFFEVSYPRYKRSDLDEWAEQFKEE
ncbi:helix-turn-helix domain-containing protein [Lactobacillus delbrueckii subsp. bulgaricus]|uniref:helix-turn-helix domain-containing protein n=1 Tax=Lactobacillus delbrueckii TaxID=1584 RepID=UPI003851C935